MFKNGTKKKQSIQWILNYNDSRFAPGFKKLAVYRDENNELHICSAVCPHLGAILQWNADEKTFDCPMHGSRFTNKGVVINGPAISDLKVVQFKNENQD